MPFGISSALEDFQRRMHEICQGLAGVAVIADDILVYGCGDTEEEYIKEHDANLKALLKRARETNLKLNRKKLKLRLSEVVYMGHHLTAKGVQPDPAKVKAIVEMPSPQNSRAPARLCDVPLTIFAPARRNGSTHTTANRKECGVYVANSASQCPRESKEMCDRCPYTEIL